MGQEIPDLKTNPPDYLVFIHRLFQKDGQVKLGGLDQILAWLRLQGKTILYLEHPLNYQEYPFSYIKLNDKVLAKKIVSPRQVPLRWLGEVLSDTIFIQKHLNKPLIALTGDPLGSLAALLLQKLGRVKHYYFHSIDYSENRFGQPILNRLYRSLYWKAAQGAAKVGVVSPRTQAKLISEGLPADKIYWLPNSPSVTTIAPYRMEVTKRNKYQLVVTCAGLEPKFRLIEILEIFGQLKTLFPHARLVMIGSQTSDPAYYQKLTDTAKKNGWVETVEFTGFLTKEDNWRKVSQSGIGLALYDPQHSHVRYGDSLKIREYAALGLPTIADGNTSTAFEMDQAKAGKIVDSPQEAADVIRLWWQKPEVYQQVTAAALRWAQANDKELLLRKLYREALSSEVPAAQP